MRRGTVLILVFLCMLWSLPAVGQVTRIVLPAGSPEDVELQEISKEEDTAKRDARLTEFVEKYAANPMAVAYGYWQLSQAKLSEGDTAAALSLGDKALAALPAAMDIVVHQVNVAQQAKAWGKVVDYAALGAKAYHGIGKDARPADVPEAEWESRATNERSSSQQSFEFLEAAAFNAVVSEQDPKARVTYLEKFASAFPETRYGTELNQYALYTFQQLNDTKRLIEFGEKTLAANPNSVPVLVMLANALAADQSGTQLAKAITYAKRAIEISKGDAADADKTARLSAGAAHSAMGYALLRQEKTVAGIAELKTAAEMLQDDPNAYSFSLYWLAWGYAKQNKLADARAALNRAVAIEGSYKDAAKELLVKVNAKK